MEEIKTHIVVVEVISYTEYRIIKENFNYQNL